MSCSDCNKPKGTLYTQAKNIATGVLNTIFKDEESKALAKPRLDICLGCPRKRELVKVKDRRVYQCLECQCIIDFKTVVKDESCPLGKW